MCLYTHSPILLQGVVLKLVKYRDNFLQGKQGAKITLHLKYVYYQEIGGPSKQVYICYFRVHAYIHTYNIYSQHRYKRRSVSMVKMYRLIITVSLLFLSNINSSNENKVRIKRNFFSVILNCCYCVGKQKFVLK
jgi:hypothetical protein